MSFREALDHPPSEAAAREAGVETRAALTLLFVFVLGMFAGAALVLLR